MNFRVGIDTGGTFTDSIAVDEKGNLTLAKSPSTPKDLKLGVMNCIGELTRKLDMDCKQFLGQVRTIVHGTTQGTNAILTRSGPKMGMLTTAGHEDAIQLRRVHIPKMWDFQHDFPQPLVPRHFRYGVKERIGAKGEVVVPLEEESVLKALTYFKKKNVKAIVVACLFSFLNPVHERMIREIIKSHFPQAHVTLSHEVAPIVGEYERFSTAIIDAYIRPVIVEYIESLEKNLNQEGFTGQLLFMQNNGGVESAEVASMHPGTLALSGPAAAPTAALEIGKLHNVNNLLSVDMGGTSFDIAVIDNSRFMVKNMSVIADHRFSLPVIDIETLGAGGGSTAWFDPGGTLRVGPRSAGADPGPACYDNGGEEATVTDANLVLGYISPDYFLGGNMKLRKDLAEKAIKDKVADKLGISVVEAAAAIHRISNSMMADGVSHSFIRRGYDPRDFVICAGGSATPLSALKIAEEIGMKKVLIPKIAPVYCPFGMLGVDLRHDFHRFYPASDVDLDLEKLKTLYKEMEAEGLPLLDKEGVDPDQREMKRTMQLRYYGQFREVEVSWPSGPITKEAIAEGVAAFHKRHHELFGSSDEKYPVEFRIFGLAVIGKVSIARLKKIEKGTADTADALKTEREVYFEEKKSVIRTKVYDGDKLLACNILEGPCIIEEKMTSIVVPPGFKVRVDDYGNYVSTE